jgi:hypothetical protein
VGKCETPARGAAGVSGSVQEDGTGVHRRGGGRDGGVLFCGLSTLSATGISRINDQMEVIVERRLCRPERWRLPRFQRVTGYCAQRWRQDAHQSIREVRPIPRCLAIAPGGGKRCPQVWASWSGPALRREMRSAAVHRSRAPRRFPPVLGVGVVHNGRHERFQPESISSDAREHFLRCPRAFPLMPESISSDAREHFLR